MTPVRSSHAAAPRVPATRHAGRPRTAHLPSHVSHRTAFTLAELLVATIMLAMLVGATYIAVSQTIRARDHSQAKADAFSRAAAAADLIGSDAQSALRDADLTNCRVLITRDGKPGSGQDGLLIFSHLNRIVRPNSGQPEGAEAEVQFRLQPGDAPGSLTLWRRTSPTIDEFPDAGGVATALVDGVKSLTVQAYDGSDWQDDWDSDIDGLPYAIRMTVTGADDNGTDSATIRRVVALDRVPLPSEAEAMVDAAQAASDAAANAANQSSGQNTTNQQGAGGTQGTLSGGNNRGGGRGNGNGNNQGNGQGRPNGGGNGNRGQGNAGGVGGPGGTGGGGGGNPRGGPAGGGNPRGGPTGGGGARGGGGGGGGR